MSEWKKICCAVDLERDSRVAVDQAADLARRFDAELTLVYVVASPPPDASEVLNRLREDAEARAGREVQSLVLAGDPVAEIVRHARKERCDLVVVGTHGRTGLPRLVLGSVAERVARRSPCPVLVAHDHRPHEHVQVEVAGAVARER